MIVVPLMAKCTNFNRRKISQSILGHISNYQVRSTVVHSWSQMNTEITNYVEVTDSTQGTNLELHNRCLCKNSQKCNPAESAVLVKVFTERNSSDIRRNEIIKEYYDKHWLEWPLNVYVGMKALFVYPRNIILYNNTFY